MKQEAKLHEGEIETISKYCPLDLFSGDLSRMKRALHDLYESPHNRFKVFKNGQLIYTENFGHKDALNDTLTSFFGVSKSPQNNDGINILTSLLCSTFLGQNQVKSDLLNLSPCQKSRKECDTSFKNLPKDSILNILLNLQKLSLEVDDVTAETLSDKMMSEVKGPDELHDLTIWYPLLTQGNYNFDIE